jgi:hypothetical protein
VNKSKINHEIKLDNSRLLRRNGSSRSRIPCKAPPCQPSKLDRARSDTAAPQKHSPNQAVADGAGTDQRSPAQEAGAGARNARAETPTPKKCMQRPMSRGGGATVVQFIPQEHDRPTRERLQSRPAGPGPAAKGKARYSGPGPAGYLDISVLRFGLLQINLSHLPQSKINLFNIRHSNSWVLTVKHSYYVFPVISCNKIRIPLLHISI